MLRRIWPDVHGHLAGADPGIVQVISGVRNRRSNAIACNEGVGRALVVDRRAKIGWRARECRQAEVALAQVVHRLGLQRNAVDRTVQPSHRCRDRSAEWPQIEVAIASSTTSAGGANPVVSRSMIRNCIRSSPLCAPRAETRRRSAYGCRARTGPRGRPGPGHRRRVGAAAHGRSPVRPSCRASQGRTCGR